MALTTAGTGLEATPCGSIFAGVQTLYFADADDITSFATSGTSDHDYQAVTFAATDYFEEINFTKGQAELTEAIEKNEFGIISNTATINFHVARMNKAQRFVIQEMMSHCQLVAVVRTFASDFIIVGFDDNVGIDANLQFASSEYSTGRARTDANQDILNFSAIHTEKCRFYTGASGTATSTQIHSELTTGTP